MTRRPVPRVGLVLGAGGIVGQAYHAGVLAALEVDLGWDARSADVIVGTSAGSVMGTALRMGLAATDLAAWAVGAEPSAVDRPSTDPAGVGSGSSPSSPISSRSASSGASRPSGSGSATPFDESK